MNLLHNSMNIMMLQLKKQNENSKIESDIFSNKIKLVKGTTKKKL